MSSTADRIAVGRSRTGLSRQSARASGAHGIRRLRPSRLGMMSLLAMEGIARGEAFGLLPRRAEMKTGRRPCLHPASDPLWVTA